MALAFVDLLEGEWQDVEKLDKSMVKKDILILLENMRKHLLKYFRIFDLWRYSNFNKNSEQTEEDKNFLKQYYRILWRVRNKW